MYNYWHVCKIMHLWYEQNTNKKWFSCKRYDTNDGNTVMILDAIHTKRRGTIFSRIRMHSATDTQYTINTQERHWNTIYTFDIEAGEKKSSQNLKDKKKKSSIYHLCIFFWTESFIGLGNKLCCCVVAINFSVVCLKQTRWK